MPHLAAMQFNGNGLQGHCSRDKHVRRLTMCKPSNTDKRVMTWRGRYTYSDQGAYYHLSALGHHGDFFGIAHYDIG